MRTVLERTGMPPGEAQVGRPLAGPEQPEVPGLLAGVTPAGRLILAALRRRLVGATAARVAADCGLSASHTRRSLRRLRSQGFAECHDATIMWGYRPRQVRLWRLAVNEATLAALPLIGWHALPPEPPPETVPPEFWYLFWSGQDASELTVADDAVHIADTLVGGFDRAARCWALNRLPLDALCTLRTMRGYNEGRLAGLIDSAIKRRSTERRSTERRSDG